MSQSITSAVVYARLKSGQEVTPPYSATQKRVEQIAMIMDVQHSMALEGQALDPNDLQGFIDQALLRSYLDL
ncbi:MAG: hypothetical protein RL196_95 [Actinomycetota bacterium]|jgi:hypothetical protein